MRSTGCYRWKKEHELDACINRSVLSDPAGLASGRVWLHSIAAGANRRSKAIEGHQTAGIALAPIPALASSSVSE